MKKKLIENQLILESFKGLKDINILFTHILYDII